MKTKLHERLLIILALATSLCAAESSTQPTVVVKRAIVLNGVANASSLSTPTSNIDVAVTGVENINTIGTAMQFQFEFGGVPVNVTDFYVTTAAYTLVNSGNPTSWIDIPHGGYNPVGDSSRPDLIVYDASGTKVSVDYTQVVSTHIPVVSKFQVLDHEIVLGGSARPKFTTVGQYYRLSRNWTFTYTYNGQQFTSSITPEQSYVRVRVFADVPNFVQGEDTGPFTLGFWVSDDMVNWVDPQVEVPNPRPTTPDGIIALVPSTMSIPGLSNLRRFFRFSQTPQ